MIITEEKYIEHFGVQGMKWGVRRSMNKGSVQKLRNKGLTGRQAKATVRYQNVVDRQKMAATGRRGKVGVLNQLNNRAISNQRLSLGTIARHPLSTKKAANLQLQKNEQLRKNILGGKAKVRNYLFELQGISMKNINFSTGTKDANRPTDYSRKKGNRVAKAAKPTPRKRAGAFIPVPA